MSTVLKFRRGDTTAANAFIGQEGELFVDTTKDTLVVHNGVTSGGNPLATESYVLANIPSLTGYATESYVTTQLGSKIALTDLSVIVNPPGSAANFTYNNTTGVFRFTPDGMYNKQDTLVSGTNIKTINGQSILGSGDITISGGGTGGSSLVYGQFADNEIDLTTTTADQVIDSYPAASYRSSKYIIQAVCSGVGIHSTEVMVMHDGTNVYLTEYATMFTDSSLFTVNANISGTGDLELTVTPSNANTSFDVVRTSLAARTYEAPSLQGDLMLLTGTEDLQSASGSLDLNV